MSAGGGRVARFVAWSVLVGAPMSRRSSLSLAALRGAALPGTAWSMAARLSAAWSLALAFACGSAGPHGYSRVYSPLDEEAEAARGAERYDPVMAHRLPE